MKKIVLFILIVVLALASTSVVLADDPVEYTKGIAKEDHKIRNKWDLTGTFVSSRSWGDVVPSGSTWTYRFHIKEAMDGEYSVGSMMLRLLLTSKRPRRITSIGTTLVIQSIRPSTSLPWELLSTTTLSTTSCSFTQRVPCGLP